MSCAEILDRYYGGISTSARRKLCRGIEQIRSLCHDAEAFALHDPCVWRVDRQNRSTHEVEYRCYAALRQPVDPDWALRAGEAVHNLRSALDHLVFAASKRPNNRTQFPIYVDRCEFEVLSKRQIPRIPPAMRAVIEEAQPFDDPYGHGWHPLEALRVLSNADKHRDLATVVAAVRQEWLGVPDGADVRWEKYATNAELADVETHISTYVVTYPADSERVDVHPGFAFAVLLESADIGMLKLMAKRVFELVIECETGEPASPFAYPLI
jgi:hypothetical protein